MEEQFTCQLESQIIKTEEGVKNLMRILPGRLYKPKLHYRASRDGMKPKQFHEKCDGLGPHIVVLKVDELEEKNGPVVFYVPDKNAWDKETKLKDNSGESKRVRPSECTREDFQRNFDVPLVFGLKSKIKVQLKEGNNEHAYVNWLKDDLVGPSMGPDFMVMEDESFNVKMDGRYTYFGYDSKDPEFKKGKYELQDFEVFELAPYSDELRQEQEKFELEEVSHFMKESALIGSHQSLFKLMDGMAVGQLTPQAKLLYRASRDGKDTDKFHELCDGKGPTLVLIKAKFQGLIGGYAPDKNAWEKKDTNWVKSQSYKSKVTKPFIFSMKQNVIVMASSENGYYNKKKYGPCFSDVLQIIDDSQVQFSFKAPDYYNKYSPWQVPKGECVSYDDYEVFELL